MQLSLAFLAIEAKEPRFIEDLLFWQVPALPWSLRLSRVFEMKF
jgi:hypothetical protein